MLVLNRRAIDLVRKQTRTRQGAFEVAARLLKDEAAEYLADKSMNLEGFVGDRLFLDQLLNDKLLNEQERLLLNAKYENPDMSITKLASETKLKHHYKVKRTFEGINKKMEHYID